MKILLISGHPRNWDAGASMVFLHLEQGLQSLGHDCVLLHAEDYLPTRLPAGVQKATQSEWVKRCALRLARQYDIIEVAGNVGWRLFEALQSLPAGSRPLLVVRLHGLEFKDEQARIEEEIARQIRLPGKYKIGTRHWINWQEFRTIASADAVFCHTSREADAIVLGRLKSEDRIHVMPLGVDESYARPQDMRQGDGDDVSLLWWGSWVERKGISALPRAFLLAWRQEPRLTLTLGGTGKEPADILSAFDPQVRERVTVLPFVSREEHRSALWKHDVFVFPSLSEGFGLALLEAMAAGLPCITTFTGMAHDWLEHGQNALIVPMSAPTALAREIVRLAHSSELRRSLSRKAEETARQLTWARFAQQTSDLYRTLQPARNGR